MHSPLPQLALNILAQPDSLEDVLTYQCGPGLPALLKAGALLSSQRRIVITGIGASMFASVTLEYLLCARGVAASVIEAAELLHYKSDAHRDAVIVIVSRSGESIEVVRLLKLLKGRQTIVGITNEPNSLLSREADISLLIGSRADEMVAIQTYTGTLLLAYLLGCATASSSEAAIEAGASEVRALLPAFSGLISRQMKEKNDWDGFFENRSPVHLLARGPSYASALEGALLFNEIAKAPAIAMLIGSFRHGPVELVDKEFRGLVFAQNGQTQGINLSLACDLVRFGGSVRVIGPQSGSPMGLQWCEIPNVPEPLSPIFDIVPVQVAAFRLAELRGIAPGSFRYTLQVAVSETSFAFAEKDRTSNQDSV